MSEHQFQETRQDLKEEQEGITTIEDQGNMNINSDIKIENSIERGGGGRKRKRKFESKL